MKPAPPVTRKVLTSLLCDYESLCAEDAPEKREPDVERDEPVEAGEPALGRVGQEARPALLDLEVAHLEGLDDGLGGQLEAMIDEVVVRRAHVAEVRLEDEEAASGPQDVAHLADDEVDLILVVEVLEDVRAEDDVEALVVEVVEEPRRVARDRLDAARAEPLDGGVQVDRDPPLGRRVLEELALAGADLEDGARRAREALRE